MTTSDDTRTPDTAILLLFHRDILIRSALAEYLRECGYTVVETGHLDEARQALRSEMHFDAAFIDVEGPASALGFALAQDIRQQRPHMKVLLAASVRRAAAEAGDLCEQGPMLSKPYDHRTLERHIQRLLAR